MNVLIIEDEKIAADHLAGMLREVQPNIHIMAVLDSVEQSVAWLQLHQPELIFLDIHLADDISFRIFERTEVKAPVIFTTAYDNYAIRAFKLNSIDYLLKPIDSAEVAAALNKYAELKTLNQPDISGLLQNFGTVQRAYQKRFLVSYGTRIKSVEVKQVAYFYADGRYVMLVATDGTRYITDFTLDRLEDVLDPIHFFRISRAIIISFASISQMHTYTKSRIKITLQPATDFDVIVSIDRSGHFRKWLNR